MLYNVVLVSGVQLSDSVEHIHISILFQILSHIGYYRTLSRVLCAVQKQRRNPHVHKFELEGKASM